MDENKVFLEAPELDGYLKEEDRSDIAEIESLYSKSLSLFSEYEKDKNQKTADRIAENAKEIGTELKRIVRKHKNIHVFSFETPKEMHGEASRIISKLRNPKTERDEFLYYIQRAYELMFSHAFTGRALPKKRSIIQKTPVDNPTQNYAVHRVPDIDNMASSSIMCVMLRGALLPSMIISKEFEDYSKDEIITPFALFRIKRDESRKEKDMRYVLDLKRSFFDKNELDGKNLIFADPMNATGGSLITISKYLEKIGVKPKSIIAINIISALKGSIRITRALEGAEVFTLWMDPVLNESAYILPGLGDAGDRLNGRDLPGKERNMIQLIADYGSTINNLYRDQEREIEKTVLD